MTTHGHSCHTYGLTCSQNVICMPHTQWNIKKSTKAHLESIFLSRFGGVKWDVFRTSVGGEWKNSQIRQKSDLTAPNHAQTNSPTPLHLLFLLRNPGAHCVVRFAQGTQDVAQTHRVMMGGGHAILSRSLIQHLSWYATVLSFSSLFILFLSSSTPTWSWSICSKAFPKGKYLLTLCLVVSSVILPFSHFTFLTI